MELSVMPFDQSASDTAELRTDNTRRAIELLARCGGTIQEIFAPVPEAWRLELKYVRTSSARWVPFFRYTLRVDFGGYKPYLSGANKELPELYFAIDRTYGPQELTDLSSAITDAIIATIKADLGRQLTAIERARDTFRDNLANLAVQ